MGDAAAVPIPTAGATVKTLRAGAVGDNGSSGGGLPPRPPTPTPGRVPGGGGWALRSPAAARRLPAPVLPLP